MSRASLSWDGEAVYNIVYPACLPALPHHVGVSHIYTPLLPHIPHVVPLFPHIENILKFEVNAELIPSVKITLT